MSVVLHVTPRRASAWRLLTELCPSLWDSSGRTGIPGACNAAALAPVRKDVACCWTRCATRRVPKVTAIVSTAVIPLVQPPANIGTRHHCNIYVACSVSKMSTLTARGFYFLQVLRDIYNLKL